MRPTAPLWPRTLRAMYARASPEARALLKPVFWELHRQHKLLIMTDDLCRQLLTMQLADMPLVVELRLALDQEPAVLIERRRRRRALAQPSIFGSAHRGNYRPQGEESQTSIEER